MIERWGEADDARRIRSRDRTIGEYFAAEWPHLNPLPDEPFEMDKAFLGLAVCLITHRHVQRLCQGQ
ncbi:hypothetical protein KMT30_23880 [Streptomyces sp. IBSBF 2953]|nr:hypothetical protein [Streptomyces hayashii]